jgi:putative ABC transport system substrate-binding protein
MKRRQFIGLAGGLLIWPRDAVAQQVGRLRKIAVLQTVAEDDPAAKVRTSALVQELQTLGWTKGRNLQIDERFAGHLEQLRTYAAEIVALMPEVILIQSNPGLAALRQINQTVPTVFVLVADPVGSGFVGSLARPGGNITGFKPSIGGKWLGLLKEAVPSIDRVAALYHAQTAANVSMLHAAESAASLLGVKITRAALQDAASAQEAIEAFAGSPGGLIVMPHPVTTNARAQIIQSALRRRLPAIGAFRYWAAEGTLMSYGVDEVDLFRRAASYIDRILRGERAADLPVQAPTKFDFVINLKVAKVLSLDISPLVLTRANEVIE